MDGNGANTNGTGRHRHSTAEEIPTVTPVVLPEYSPVLQRPQLVISREVAYGVVGVGLGVILALLIMRQCSKYAR